MRLTARPPLSSAIISIALAGALLAAARADGQQEKAPTASPPTTVEAVVVQPQEVAEEIVVIGTLASNESVIIRPEIAGRVSKINFSEGERIKKGQALVSLDASVQEAELKEAEAALSVSRRNFERAEELLRKGVGAVRQRDEALGALEADRARVALMHARLQKMTLTAPFDGVLGLREVSVGAYVTPGQNIVNLENIDPVKVEFRVPETSLRDLREGQSIRIRVDAYPKAEFNGEVYAIDPRIDAGSRSVAIRARIPNPDGKLRPGLFAKVALVTHRRNNVVAPEAAIEPRGDEQFVYRVVDGKAALTKVQLGVRRAGKVEIVKGLAPGDLVVTAGQIKLRDGAPVRVVQTKESS
jgi:membrane fusion protein (multidrug efflux system)